MGQYGNIVMYITQELMKHHDTKKNDLSYILICAITKAKIYLLDWRGTHNKGKDITTVGPTQPVSSAKETTEILAEFDRYNSKMKFHTRRLIYHIVEIKEDGNLV